MLLSYNSTMFPTSFNVPPADKKDPREDKVNTAAFLMRDDSSAMVFAEEERKFASKTDNINDNDNDNSSQGSNNTDNESLIKEYEAESIELESKKPKRPLSGYNVFFQEQRKRMLEVLPVRESGKPKDSHGKIGFAAMARTVAKMWKEVDPEAKAEYERLSEIDKKRYAREMDEWKKKRAALDAKQKVARKEQQKKRKKKQPPVTKDSSIIMTQGQGQEDHSRLRQSLSAAAQRAYPGPVTMVPAPHATAAHLLSTVQQQQLPQEVILTNQPTSSSLHSQQQEPTASEYYSRCQHLGLFDLLERNLGQAGMDFVRETFQDNDDNHSSNSNNNYHLQL